MTSGEDTCRTCPTCGRGMTRINGRTLRLSRVWGAALRRKDDNRWIHVCPVCEREALFGDHQVALPFQDRDNVMRTVQDEPRDTPDVLSMAGFTFTRHALESAVALANHEDDEAEAAWCTAQIEAQAQQYRNNPSPQSALALLNAICHWGRGDRVRGNLHKRHGTTLGSRMDRWMRASLLADTDEAAIASVSPTREAGRPEGLGVSFGSKHLRMLDPDRFAVLDSVLSEGLGYALNPKGYALFMRHLRDFHQQLSASGWGHSLARTESGLFVLVRQNVRVESDQPVTPSEA